MNNIILEIKEQIYQTITLATDFFKGTDLKTLLLSLGLFYIIFLRKWPLKKIGSFFFTTLLLFILMIRTESFLVTRFGTDNSMISIGICRVVFVIVTAVVFIYNAAVKE
ncbi:MAG TPA: hypothetical protein DCL35_00345 [Candidatus Omnitrophica bacterium]|nr:hypothetical protein [Candidatus Omnitrophota bacterium]